MSLADMLHNFHGPDLTTEETAAISSAIVLVKSIADRRAATSARLDAEFAAVLADPERSVGVRSGYRAATIGWAIDRHTKARVWLRPDRTRASSEFNLKTGIRVGDSGRFDASSIDWATAPQWLRDLAVAAGNRGIP